MKARDKYIRVFGELKSLADQVSWSTGVSNMLEWLTWGTSAVLGVSKTRYASKIVGWSHEKGSAALPEKLQFVTQRLDAEMRASERLERYAPANAGIASPREALRRAKYFSEDYLNKEFDIFWTLVSDAYLDKFYSQFTQIRGGGRWATHGNSGLFATSTEIREMQMDNLSYNETERLLVANELKLGGTKNQDQILKYAWMFKRLREKRKDKRFIDPDTRFLLLFIGDGDRGRQWHSLIEAEVDFCRKSSKSTAKAACQPEVVAIAKNAEYASTTWGDLIDFNKKYSAALDPTAQQVECKLLKGFNESLGAKHFIRSAPIVLVEDRSPDISPT